MKDEHLRVKNKPKKLSVIKKVKKQLDKLDRAYTSNTTPLYKSLSAKLKNTWKEYRSTMKDQSSKVETNVFKFKSNKPFKKK